VVVACVSLGYRLGAQSLWLDEIYHRYIGLLSVDQIVNQGDLQWQQLAHGYYLLIKWSHYVFDEPSLASRTPSFVCGVLAVLFLFLLVREWFGSAAGCVAVLLVCTAPTIVRWTQDARFYSHSALGVVACSYFLDQFLKKPGIWTATLLCIGLSFFLRLHAFAFLFIAILLFLTVVYLASCAAVATSKEQRALILRTFTLLTVCVAGVALLWMPFPLRLVKYYLNHGSAGSSPDVWWTAPFPLTPIAVWRFIQEGFLLDVAGGQVTLLVTAGLLLAAVFRKPRIILFSMVYLLSTIALIFAMNQSKAVVTPKRFLFLGYVYALLIAGGGALVARLLAALTSYAVAKASRAVRMLISTRVESGHDTIPRVAGVIVAIGWWLVFLYVFVVPPVSRGSYDCIAQYYWEERAPYKVLAQILSRYYNKGEQLAWNPPSNDSWLLTPYLSAGNGPPADYVYNPLTRPQLSRQRVDEVLRTSGGLWLHGIDPREYGFSEGEYVAVPYAGRTTFWLRVEFLTNITVRNATQEELLLATINASSFPAVDTVDALVQHYKMIQRPKLAELAVERLLKYRVSTSAVDYVVKHYDQNGSKLAALHTFARHADVFWWRDDIQLRAAQMAVERGEYKIAKHYATRFLLPFSRMYLQRAELAGKACMAIHDYVGAEKWLKRACKQLRRRAQHDQTHMGNMKVVEAMRDQALLYTRTHERLVEQLEEWKEASFYRMGAIQRTLHVIATNSAMRGLFVRQAENKRRREPELALLAAMLGTNGMSSEVYREFARSVRAKRWPVYVYAMEQVIPQKYHAAALIRWDELGQRGFRSLHEMSEASIVWLAQFYERHVGYPAITGFYWAASAKAPERRWWSAICSAEAAYRAGRFDDAKQLLHRYERVIVATPRGRARYASLKHKCLSELGKSHEMEMRHVILAKHSSNEFKDVKRVSIVLNGSFRDGGAGWAYWGGSNHVHFGDQRVRLKAMDRQLRGICQKLAQPLVSGRVYYLSAKARTVEPANPSVVSGIRVALHHPPQPEYDLVWLSQLTEWREQSRVFTNTVDGWPSLLIHVGYGGVTGTFDITDVELIELGTQR